MILTLDTSTVVDLLRGEQEAVRDRFSAARARGDELKLSTVALHELAYGAHKSDRPEAHLAALDRFLSYVEVVPFEGDDALAAGRARAEVTRLPFPGSDPGVLDIFIGAQALTRGWAVVTSNLRHFVRMPGLRLIDWRRSDEPISAQDIIARLTRGTED